MKDERLNIDKIEAAAKAAHKPDTAMHEIQGHWIMSSPATVLEMVSMIRAKDDLLEAFRESERELMDQRDERDVVLKQALEILQDNRDDVARVERPQYMRDYYDPAVAAIKGVLK
jgi:hypothetical protein